MKLEKDLVREILLQVEASRDRGLRCSGTENRVKGLSRVIRWSGEAA